MFGKLYVCECVLGNECCVIVEKSSICQFEVVDAENKFNFRWILAIYCRMLNAIVN